MSFNRALGFAADDEGTIVLDTRPEHEVMPGTIHFAVLATLGEVAAASAAAAGASARQIVPTHLAVQLLRRAVPGRLAARGRLLKSGRTLAFAEGEVTQEGQLVAKVAVTFARLG
ncbi:MAG: PaaI family thioesterase [Thermoanaerobaculia bacterium]